MKKKKKHKLPVPKLKRDKRVSFMLNEEESKTINAYLSKYNIRNRSNWYRETLFAHILTVLEKDYPTLFSENEMRR